MRQKIIFSLLLLFVLVASGAGIASWHVTHATDQLRRLVDLHEVEGLRRNLVISLQTVQADLYTLDTPMARNPDGIVANVRTLDDAAHRCDSCHHRPEIRKQLDEVQALIEEYKIELSHFITASANKKRIERIKTEAATLGNHILLHTEKMSARASQRLDKLTDVAIVKIHRVRIILLTTVLFTIALCVSVSVSLLRSVTRPIEQLVGATGIIASGDLTHRVEEMEEPEFQDLASHFNTMSTALQESYVKLRRNNEDLQREINERKALEQHREALQAQLLRAQKLEAVGTLAAGIAHEFGNSLQIIQSSFDRLRTKTAALEVVQPELRLIGDAAHHASDLTRRLLTFGRKLDTQLEPLDLNDQVLHVQEILRGTLPKTIEIRSNLAETLPRVKADHAQIEHVLVNLALNAKDAMPEGGTLSIETTRVDAKAISPGGAEAASNEDWVRLCVSDTGEGMDDATAARIFDPFFTTKGVGVGTGLGLSVVYGIVKGLGGHISCQSELGRGAVFEIFLPGMAEKAAAAEAEKPAKKLARRGGETLLLVDDEVIMTDVLGEALEYQGFVVHAANSGERALELFEQYRDEIELVILDLCMPGMGGRACLAKLVELDPQLKVIISSGQGSQSDQEELIKAGASGFLVKPYQTSSILSEIDAVLSTGGGGGKSGAGVAGR